MGEGGEDVVGWVERAWVVPVMGGGRRRQWEDQGKAKSQGKSKAKGKAKSKAKAVALEWTSQVIARLN